MRLALASIIAVVILTACSGRPTPEVIVPQADAEVQGARIVRIFSMTTRAQDAEAPWAFGANRALNPHYMAYDISIPPNHAAGRIEWPKNAARMDPAKAFVTRDQTELERKNFIAEIGRNDVGLFIHGFNTSYTEALYRLAQLKADAHLDGTAVLFSWPSQAHAAAYLADRDGSDYSRDALVQLLTDLTSGRSTRKPVKVLAHSMGARMTVESIRQLKLSGRQDILDRIELVLAAPDIDFDVFRRQMAVIGKMRHPITILVSSDDGALRLSSRLAARRTRLGQVDVSDPKVQEMALNAGIRILDITNLPSDDTAHSRYVGLLSVQPTEADSPFDGLRNVGAFVFDRVGDTFKGIGTALNE